MPKTKKQKLFHNVGTLWETLLNIRNGWSLLLSWLGMNQNQKNRWEHRKLVDNPDPASEPCPLLTQLSTPYSIPKWQQHPAQDYLHPFFPLLSASPWDLLQNLIIKG